jgi:hypothetical protein
LSLHVLLVCGVGGGREGRRGMGMGRGRGSESSVCSQHEAQVDTQTLELLVHTWGEFSFISPYKTKLQA